MIQIYTLGRGRRGYNQATAFAAPTASSAVGFDASTALSNLAASFSSSTAFVGGVQELPYLR